MLPPPLFLFAVGTCAVSNKLESSQGISQSCTHPTADCIFSRILLYAHLLGMTHHTHTYIHTYTHRLLEKVCTLILNPLFFLHLKASQKNEVRLISFSEFCAAMTADGACWCIQSLQKLFLNVTLSCEFCWTTVSQCKLTNICCHLVVRSRIPDSTY